MYNLNDPDYFKKYMLPNLMVGLVLIAIGAICHFVFGWNPT